MASFSELQKRLSAALLDAPLSVEELEKRLSVSGSTLGSALKEMMRLELIEKKEGYPTKYALKPAIASEVARRRELAQQDQNALRVRATIEGQAVTAEILQKQMHQLSERLEKDKAFLVYGVSHAPILKQDDTYSTFVELTVSIKDFKTLIRFMMLYGPTTVEILSPSKISFTADDMQDGIHDLSIWVHQFAESLAKYMNRAELESFNKKLLQ